MFLQLKVILENSGLSLHSKGRGSKPFSLSLVPSAQFRQTVQKMIDYSSTPWPSVTRTFHLGTYY